MKERIELFVKTADKVTADFWFQSGYTHSAPPTHRADYISPKWVRIVTVENGHDSYVYAFICLQDGATKALGQLKVGDIHKASSFKMAAKHARGNIFADDFAKCLTEYGIVYLK